MSNNYTKPPLKVENQIKLLQERNLIITNIDFASAKLNHIGYYHLSAYFKSFQNKEMNTFHQNVDFEQILNLYVFDRKIKLFSFDAIERIELSLKSILTNIMTESYGAFWYTNKDLFDPKFSHESELNYLLKIINRVKDKDSCIKKYYVKYPSEKFPPSWILMEVLPLGSVLKLFRRLKKEHRKKIAEPYEIDEKILLSWLTLLLDIRNICAHHERLWNRNLKKIVIPKNLEGFSDSGKIWNAFLIINHFLNLLSPDSLLISNLKKIISESHVNLLEMGFCEHWQEFLLTPVKTIDKNNIS